MPRACIIIPTYNRAHLISRAIDSVLNQTYQDFELIVVDDASKDNTVEVINQIGDSRIRTIRHQVNLGAPAARNTGITAAESNYIGFLDDDDEWLPDKLEKQIGLLSDSSSDVGLVYCGFYFISGINNKVLTISPNVKGNLYPDILRRNIPAGNTPLIKRECFKKAGLFDTTLPSCQDWDMWIRLSKYYLIEAITEPLSRVYIHGDQISTNLNLKIEAREILIHKYYEELINFPYILTFLYRRLGILYCLSNNIKKALDSFFKSLKLNPYQKGIYINMILSLIIPTLHNKYLRKKEIFTFDEIEIFY